MFITPKHRSSLNLNGVFSSSRVIMPLYKWKTVKFSFPFSNLSLRQPNDMKLKHNAYYRKLRSSIGIWLYHFNRS